MDWMEFWLWQWWAAAWDVLVASAPYMLLGFFVAGLLKAFLSDDLIARHLGTESFSGLVKAAALGVPIPLCSCGVLPAAAGLRQQGAGKGPTTAFLISTPETGVDSVAVTWALLDPIMTVVRPIAAFVTALFTGAMVQVFDREQKIEGPVPLVSRSNAVSTVEPSLPHAASTCSAGSDCGCPGGTAKTGTTPWQRLAGGMGYAFGDLFRDIAPWFLAGILIAGGISVWLTPELVSRWLGHPFLAMLAMLVISVPLYVCAAASTPIAAALVLKGLNPGAALVFLLAGPATNAAALAVIGKILGRRATAIYLAGIMASSLAMGILVDWIYLLSGGPGTWRLDTATEDVGFMGLLSALILLALFVWSRVRGTGLKPRGRR
ncbi:SO_0444 family Cu/Zn efflux transporter [Desulfonatronum thioautotrophicum]|uniref:SO_0444 family Cu/Zn efflux transporter n=1 Tax=Desulfonatronum thioautotrophicum TaxID=617001 RepID=UPI0005EAD7C6|nr:SO_0444 family Cu/Zn efflux transporter [Desulfonatronum thioautotrophicum]